MLKIVLCGTTDAEEILIRHNNNKFIVMTQSVGEYGFGKLVLLKVVKDDLTKEIIKKIAFTKKKIDWDDNRIEHEIVTEGCLIKGLTTFEDALDKACRYIGKFD